MISGSGTFKLRFERQPLLIGQAPARGLRRGSRAFAAGGSARHLAKLAGVTLDELHSRVTAVNVLRRWPGKSAKGDRFPIDSARRAARRMMTGTDYGACDRVIFAGQGVVRAFARNPKWARELIAQPCVWLASAFDVRAYAYLPHPSGVNRWYNEQSNRDLASRFLRDLMEAKPCSTA